LTTVVTGNDERQNAEEVRATGMMKMAAELLRHTGTKHNSLSVATRQLSTHKLYLTGYKPYNMRCWNRQ